MYTTTKEHNYIMSDFYTYYNPHPKQKVVKDCVKRALVKATGKDYMEVQRELNRLKKELNAKEYSDNVVWTTYLTRLGFERVSYPAVKGQSRMTVAKLAAEVDYRGVFVCSCARHLVCVTDLQYFDNWDCGDKCVYTAWYKIINE